MPLAPWRPVVRTACRLALLPVLLLLSCGLLRAAPASDAEVPIAAAAAASTAAATPTESSAAPAASAGPAPTGSTAASAGSPPAPPPALALPAPAPAPPACDLSWHIVPLPGAVPRLLVTLTLDAGSRSRLELQLPDGGEVAQLAGEGAPALEPVPGRPQLRSLVLRPADRTRLRLLVAPMPGAWLRLGDGSLVFSAPALLPLPTERGSAQMCVVADVGIAPGQPRQVLANQGQVDGNGVLRLQGPMPLARDWLVAAGMVAQARLPLPARSERGDAAATLLLADRDAGWPGAEAMAGLAGEQWGRLQRFWSDPAALPPPWLALWAAAADSPPRARARADQVLLQAPAGSPPDEALRQGWLQTWLRLRFGPVAYEQRPDEGMNDWFVGGFAAFYAMRLQAAPGEHSAASLEAQAQALSRWLRSGGPAATGPWLAMRWHSELREQGHAGLDAVLRRLQLPAAQARATGPLSAPLAPHRLLAALRATLADRPRHDLQQFVERNGPPDLSPATLGPCFRADAGGQRIVPAQAGEPDAACRGWLDGSSAPAGVAAADHRSAKAKPGKAAKGSKTAKPGKTTKPKAAKAAPKGGKSARPGRAAAAGRSAAVH